MISLNLCGTCKLAVAIETTISYTKMCININLRYETISAIARAAVRETLSEQSD